MRRYGRLCLSKTAWCYVYRLSLAEACGVLAEALVALGEALAHVAASRIQRHRSLQCSARLGPNVIPHSHRLEGVYA